MNEPIVSSLATQDENHLIYYTPQERCIRCNRLTNVGVLDVASPTYFMPYCPLHGLCSSYGLEPTVREQQDTRASIERFVTWMFCDQGRCPLIVECEIEQVPGYDLPAIDPLKFEPLSWSIRYEAPDGVRVDVHAVWDIDISTFSLYRDGSLVCERREIIAEEKGKNS